MEEVNQDERPFPCPHCDKRFTSKKNINRHLNTHLTERPFTCEQEKCYKTFKTKSDLRKHLGRHSNASPHNCERCKKSFFNKDYLMRHVKRVHSMKKGSDDDELQQELKQNVHPQRSLEEEKEKEMFVEPIVNIFCSENLRKAENQTGPLPPFSLVFAPLALRKYNQQII